jgi:hypothetical protein
MLTYIACTVARDVKSTEQLMRERTLCKLLDLHRMCICHEKHHIRQLHEKPVHYEKETNIYKVVFFAGNLLSLYYERMSLIISEIENKLPEATAMSTENHYNSMYLSLKFDHKTGFMDINLTLYYQNRMNLLNEMNEKIVEFKTNNTSSHDIQAFLKQIQKALSHC